MTAPLGKLSPEQFLQEFWQKKPHLIRQAIPGFKALINGDDLAGLACEEMAESRIITGTLKDADWDVRNGPFSDQDFSNLGEQNWTLLVQDVEKHYAPLQALMQQFNFIPNWRLDDLMVSFAATGGSVGPHVDQYDVFLLQASGSRCWQIAETFDPGLLEDCQLNVLKQFTPEQEWTLEAGDMLYLPPNVAHHGIALEPGMTWSIGSRAPSAADLLQGFGEWLAFTDSEGERYSDPSLSVNSRAGEINLQALQQLRDTMLNCIDENEGLNDYFSAFLSRFRLAHDPQPPPKLVNPKRLLGAMKDGARLMRNPWTRLTWVENKERARLYAAGQPYDCSIWLAELLCEQDRPEISTDLLDQNSFATLVGLVNNGHFVLMSTD